MALRPARAFDPALGRSYAELAAVNDQLTESATELELQAEELEVQTEELRQQTDEIADRIRGYRDAYGTTLNGLMRHHTVEPDHYVEGPYWEDD